MDSLHKLLHNIDCRYIDMMEVIQFNAEVANLSAAVRKNVATSIPRQVQSSEYDSE